MTSKKVFICDVCGKEERDDFCVPMPDDWYTASWHMGMNDWQYWEVCSLACFAALPGKAEEAQRKLQEFKDGAPSMEEYIATLKEHGWVEEDE